MQRCVMLYGENMAHVMLQRWLRTMPRYGAAKQEPVGQDGIHSGMVCA